MQMTHSHTSLLSFQQLLLLEQWVAFLLGMICLGVSLWAAVQGDMSFRWAHAIPWAEYALSASRWLLTLGVSLTGCALIRFAFYKPSGNASNEPA